MQNNQNSFPARRKNLLIILALAALAAVLLLISRVIAPPNATRGQEEIDAQIAALATQAPQDAKPEAPAQAQAYLYIILNNRLWGIEPLGEEREVTVDQGNGTVNVIHLLPDGFYMASSTCDNQLCVGEGTVTLTNWQQRILGPCVYCLPHNLQLELVVPNAAPDPNALDA